MNKLRDWLRSLGESNVMHHFYVYAAFVALMVSFGTATYRGFSENRLKQQKLNFETQIETLDAVQSSLKDLTTFVTQQRQRLQESQSTLAAYKAEQEKLKPIVEADRKTADAILEFQAARTSAGVWTERAIAFFLGVASSFLASLLLSLLVRKQA
jgi:hypothetical protein